MKENIKLNIIREEIKNNQFNKFLEMEFEFEIEVNSESYLFTVQVKKNYKHKNKDLILAADVKFLDLLKSDKHLKKEITKNYKKIVFEKFNSLELMLLKEIKNIENQILNERPTFIAIKYGNLEFKLGDKCNILYDDLNYYLGICLNIKIDNKKYVKIFFHEHERESFEIIYKIEQIVFEKVEKDKKIKIFKLLNRGDIKLEN